MVNGGSDSNRFERIPSEGGKVIKVDDARVRGSVCVCVCVSMGNTYSRNLIYISL